MPFYRLQRKNGPIHYDEMAGFVIFAHSEQQARSLAVKSKGDESAEIWLDDKNSTCEKLLSGNFAAPQVILTDYNVG